MRPNVVRKPRRPMLHVQMHMWGQMMLKRGETKFFARISHDALELLPVLMRIPSLWSPVLILVWIGEGVPTSSSQMMSRRMIEVILLFDINNQIY